MCFKDSKVRYGLRNKINESFDTIFAKSGSLVRNRSVDCCDYQMENIDFFGPAK